tara:strand:- start:82 stop:5958 length:5877 start_codon:yes stop_codon:yes gene_type:complete
MSTRKAFSSNSSLGETRKIEKEASASFDNKNLPEAFISVTLPSGTLGKTRKRDYDLFTFKGILSLDDPSHSKWGLTDETAANQQRNKGKWFSRIHGSNAKEPTLSGLTSAHGDNKKTLIQGLFADGPDVDYLSLGYDGITIVSTKLKTPGAPATAGTDLFKFNVVFSKDRLNVINNDAAVKYAQKTGVPLPPGAVLGAAQSYDLFVYDQNQPGQSVDPNSDHQPMFSLEIRKGAFKDKGIRKFLKLMRDTVRRDETSTSIGDDKGKYEEAHLFRQMLGRYYVNLVNSKVDGRMLEPMFCFIRRVAGEDGDDKNSAELFDADTCLFGYWFGVRNFDVTTEWPMDESKEIKVKDGRGATKSLRFKDVKASLNVFSAFLHLSRSVLINIRELDLNMSINHITGLFTTQTEATLTTPTPKMNWFVTGGDAEQPNADNDYPIFANSANKAATLQRDIREYCRTLRALLDTFFNHAQHKIDPTQLITFTNASKQLVNCITTLAQGAEPAMDASEVVNPLIIAQTTSDIEELLGKHKMLTKRFVARVISSVLNGATPMEYKDIVAHVEDADRKISMLSANVGYQTAKIFKNLKVLDKRLSIEFKPGVKDATIWAYSKKSYKLAGIVGTGFRSSKRGFEPCKGIGGTNGITIRIGESINRKGKKFVGRSSWIDAFRFFQFNGLDLAATGYNKEIGDSYGLFGAVMIAQASTRRAMSQGVSGQNTLAGLVATCDKVETYLENILKQTHRNPYKSIFKTYDSGETIDIDTRHQRLYNSDRVPMIEWRKIYFLLHENYGFGITGNNPDVKCGAFAGGAGDPFVGGAVYNVIAAGQGNSGCGWNQIPMGYHETPLFKRPLIPVAGRGAISPPEATQRCVPIQCTPGHSTMGLELDDFVAPYANGDNGSVMHAGPDMDGYNQAITHHQDSVFAEHLGATLQFETYTLANNDPQAGDLNRVAANNRQGLRHLSGLGTSHYESFMLVSAAANSDAGDLAMRGVYKQDIQETLNLVKVAKIRVAKLMKIKQSLIMQNSLHKATGNAAHKLALSGSQPGTQLVTGGPNTWAIDMVRMGDQLANIINYYLMANQLHVGTGTHPAIPICQKWSNIFGLNGPANHILKSDGTVLTYGFGAPNVSNAVNTAWNDLNPTAYALTPTVLSVAAHSQQLLAVFTARHGPPDQPNVFYLKQAAGNVNIAGIPKNVINRAVIIGAVNTLITDIGTFQLQREAKCQLMSSVYCAYNPNAGGNAPLNVVFGKSGSGGNLTMNGPLPLPPLIPSNPAANPLNQKIANQNNSDHALLRVLIAQCRRLNDLAADKSNARAVTAADYTEADPNNVASYVNIYGTGADAPGPNAANGPWNKLRNRLLNLHHTALKTMADSLHDNLKNMDLSPDLLTMTQPLAPATFAKFVNAQMKFRRDAPKFLKMCYNAGLTFQMLLPRFGFILEPHVPITPTHLAALTGPAAAVPIGNQYRVSLPAAAPQGMDISEVCLLFDVFMGVAGATPPINGADHYKYECAPMLPNYDRVDVRINCPLASYGNVGCVKDDPVKQITDPGHPDYKFTEIKGIFDHIKLRKQGLNPYTQWANIAATATLGTGLDGLCNNLQECQLGTTGNYIVQNSLFDNMVSTARTDAQLRGAHFGNLGDSSIVNFAQFGGIANAGLKYTSGIVVANTRSGAFPGPRGTDAKGSLGEAELFSGFSNSDGLQQNGNLFDDALLGTGLLDSGNAVDSMSPYSRHMDDTEWTGGTPRCFIEVATNNYTNPYTLNATTLVRMRSLPALDFARVLQTTAPVAGAVVWPGITSPAPMDLANAIRNNMTGVLSLVDTYDNAVTAAVGGGAGALLPSKVGPPTQQGLVRENSRPDAFLDLMYKVQTIPRPVAPAVYVPSACEHYEEVMRQTRDFANVNGLFEIGDGAGTDLTTTVIQAGGGSSAQFGGSAKLCYGSYVNYFNQLYKTNPKLAKTQMKKLFKKIR